VADAARIGGPDRERMKPRGALRSAPKATVLASVQTGVEGRSPMNHTSIAMQALCYRMAMISDSFTSSRCDPAQIAKVAVECGDPTIDYAIRRIGTAWVGGGLPREAIAEPWSGPLIDRIFAEDPTLLDAIDDIIRTVHRHQFSRPRGGTPATPHHRPTFVPRY